MKYEFHLLLGYWAYLAKIMFVEKKNKKATRGMPPAVPRVCCGWCAVLSVGVFSNRG